MRHLKSLPTPNAFPVRAGVLILAVSSMAACTTHTSHPHEGIVYHAGAEASYTLKSSCVREAIQARGKAPAVRLTLQPGTCTREFKHFTSAHQGDYLTAEFDGSSMSEPARIVSSMGPSFVQPVRSRRQKNRIMAFYHQ